MGRHTTFKFCLDPSSHQQAVLSRHAGAARFAFNQCLHTVKSALVARRSDSGFTVPWSGFDLINHFNQWKKSENAGRVFVVDNAGDVTTVALGLSWRDQVCQQVFEEAAVDCGRALAARADSRRGARPGRRVGFPRFKKKAGGTRSFRLRNKHSQGRRPSIRIGDGACARSVTLPMIGVIRVHDDTRRLRRMLAAGRAKILFATVSFRAGRWWIAVNVEADELHPQARHQSRDGNDSSGWIGVDRGLSALVVAGTCDGIEVARADHPPRALAAGLKKQRRLSRSICRKTKGSNNRRRCVARLGRHHARMRNIRHHFLHQVSNQLVKTHDRLVLEDLNTAGMLRNPRLARAISDAAWAEFARQVRYKQAWRGGEVLLANRWYPSSRVCSRCGARNRELTLADRVFSCENGHRLDRDLNAAVNLAAWGERNNSQAREPEARAPVINVRRRASTGRHPRVGETGPTDAETKSCALRG
ncbi:RNA-guided endonuclease InsQ/TnpB family protein [Nocardia sp. NPDC006044]|uniref:RNA-guided endonuclease InsQ/TnpB family protein n=1 Tax=Nocardia sp. NPDC006044 TaxID=3364306 RepID=UPI00367CB7CB